MPKDLNTNLMSEKIISIIKKFMVFESIDCGQLKTILNTNPESDNDEYHKRIAKICQYDEGETVIHEGEFDSWSFWVVKGVFNVIQKGVTIATFSTPGEIFGEMSVFEGIPRTASVVAKTTGICLGMDMSIIENLGDEKIESLIKEGFYSVILNRLAASKEKIYADKKELELKFARLLEFENSIKYKAKKKT
ncbi:MAG: hypothetical protein A2277_04705 [Desulfobacterales bacterium RIFOXYA12_FULL_46_15]|nr:MAG: hypothetical protein A2097_08410 [Desulfobacula sp. GWF2_41_7]OGR25309.1 MAG: hypothetical protein A2277_04705 [Desulfobacterales bacterium RIFOXYA12_FULL_46_15]